ncbi:hypothetical protein ACRXCV_00010 (plasmid) [Halobacteriovorax sp. GFR7]|uniref:hypothetical protein n=1 Tax=unclassified Halobacteriovorax TaxID=2639665 RepID=UPI003D9940A0
MINVNKPQHFDIKPDAPQAIKDAVESGKIPKKQAYEAGFADIRCNAMQTKFMQCQHYNSNMEQILLNLDMVLSNSGVSIDALCGSAKDVCSEQEIKALVHWHQNPKGLIYYGEVSHVYKRMEAMTAALVRNFIDARIYTVNDMVEQFLEGDLQGQVIVVPDFFTKVCENKTHDPFMRHKTNAYSFLIKMRQQGQRAIVYTHDIGLFSERHGGQLLHDLLKEQFYPVEV